MKNHFAANIILAAPLLAIALAGVTPFALAHSGEKHDKPKAIAPLSKEEHAFGRQGDPKKVTRTIKIDMNDMMRFSPSDIRIRQGETIKFVVHNKGGMMHEMVIGTMKELKEHGEMMKKHPGMEHDEPYMAHVSAGKAAEVVWQFTKAGEFNYACLIPGHFEAGMVGKITVAAK